jgi:2-polyprenyl-6-methoxyphenol hydroxylase-like FAD-dependent oxidoreductase
LISGQGASVAMTAAFVLADELRKARSVPAGLLQYEAKLHPFILKHQQAARSFARWLVPETQLTITARNWLLSAAQLPGMNWLLREMLLPSIRATQQA